MYLDLVWVYVSTEIGTSLSVPTSERTTVRVNATGTTTGETTQTPPTDSRRKSHTDPDPIWFLRRGTLSTFTVVVFPLPLD